VKCYASRRFDGRNDAIVLVEDRGVLDNRRGLRSKLAALLRRPGPGFGLSDLPAGIASTPNRSLVSRSPSLVVFSDDS
jgi:hypothetical protein